MKYLLILVAVLALGTGLSAQKKMGDKMKMEKMDMKTDHFMMEDGKMMMTMKGETMPMDKDRTLSNGTVVKMDGTVKRKNGKARKLKNGEMIYVNGKRAKMKH